MILVSKAYLHNCWREFHSFLPLTSPCDKFFVNVNTGVKPMGCISLLEEVTPMGAGADPGILVRGGVKVAGSTDRQNLFFRFFYFIDLNYF